LDNNHQSTLTLKGLKLWVDLGVEPAERENPQAISLDILLFFNTPPTGALTDDIEDTISYKIIYDIVAQTATSKAFKLIEHLAACIYTNIYSYIKNSKTGLIDFTVEITKLNPPLANVHGGACFTYSGPALDFNA
jgi:dihydroneopterin aldolase